MKNLTFIILLTLLICSCSNSTDSADEVIIDPTDDSQPPLPEPIFYKGMDLSFQSELENYNVVYKDDNATSVDLLSGLCCITQVLRMPSIFSMNCDLIISILTSLDFRIIHSFKYGI
jgi:hypothetical protein